MFLAISATLNSHPIFFHFDQHKAFIQKLSLL